MIVPRLKKITLDWQSFFSDPFERWITGITLGISVFQAFTLAVLYSFIPPQVPLFFSRPWGDEQLVDKKYLFILPLSLLILVIVNTVIAVLFFQSDKLLPKIFLGTTTIAAFLFCIALGQILLMTTV